MVLEEKDVTADLVSLVEKYLKLLTEHNHSSNPNETFFKLRDDIRIDPKANPTFYSGAARFTPSAVYDVMVKIKDRAV